MGMLNLNSQLARQILSDPSTKAARFTVTLSLPPSSNNLFRNAGKRRILSTEYEDWRTGSQVLMRKTRLVRVPSPVSITLTVLGKVNRQRDLANHEKAVVDFLVSLGIIVDDNLKHVHELHMLYRPDEGEARIEVVVETLTRKESDEAVSNA